jgi:hypothetical protein
MEITNMEEKTKSEETENFIDSITVNPSRPVNFVNSKMPEEETPKAEQVVLNSETELRSLQDSFFTKNKRVQTINYFGQNGQEVKDNVVYFAKKVTTKREDGSEVVRCSLAIYNGCLFKPAISGKSNQRVRDYLIFKVCTEECFSDYLSYLENGKEQLYLKSNRGIMNG